MNGDLKGHELLYIKKQDAFVPMKENWVNYLIARKPHMLGEASQRNTQELGGLMPSLMRLNHPPTATKYGSDLPIDDWAKPALPMLAALMTGKARALYGEKVAGDLNLASIVARPYAAALAGTAATFDLRSALDEFGLLKLAYEKGYRSYPLIKRGFDTFYGPDFFAKMATEIKERTISEGILKSARSYMLPPEKPVRKKKGPFLIDEPEAPPHPIKSGALQIIVHDPITGGYGLLDKRADKNDVSGDVAITDNKPELDDEERERLLHDHVLIKDKRDPHAVSVAYNTQVRTALTNPDTTALFNVLEKPGTFDRMLVITHPHTGRGHENFATVVRLSDPRAWLNTHPTNLWVNQADQPEQPTDTEFRDWVDGLDSSDSLTKGGIYIAVGRDGSGTCPFEIREDYGDGAYRVHWHDDTQYGKDRPAFLPDTRGWNHSWDDPEYRSWDAKIRIRQEAQRLRTVHGELSIPETHKILKLKDPPEPRKSRGNDLIGMCGPCDDPGGPSQTKPPPVEPGNLVDIQLYLHEKHASGELDALQVHDTGGGEVWLKARGRTERMAKRAALISLVRDHGLDEPQSRAILKEAAALAVHNGAVNYAIKYADQFGSTLQPGPGAPAFPQPWTGSEQVGYGSYPSIYSQEEHLPVPGMDSNLTDPSIYDPFYMPDQKTMQVAQTAAQSGQKEVFDTSMISGMLKAVRQESLVDRYMGDLMKALNALGRIIFMFYWHQEEFADRYGKDELPEMEDGLRNAMESLGDIALYLKERTVQSGTGTDISGKNTQTDTPSPSIVESARN